MKRIAIIGGGFAGLGAAYHLAKCKNVSLTLFERSADIGGLAGAFRVGDTYLEQYYHHLFPTYRDIIPLAKTLGIGNKLFFRKAASASFVEGNLYPFSSAFDVLRFSPLSFFDRLRLGFGIAYLKFITNWRRFENVSASSWLEQFFGNRIYHVVWKPLLVGKFGDYAEQISMAWFWSRIYERPAKFGYFEGGFKTLTDALKLHLTKQGIILNLEISVLGIEPQNDGRFIVQTKHNHETFDAVLVAATPKVFLQMVHQLPEQYTQKMKQLKYYGTVSLVLTLNKPFSPYYWINIQDSSLPFLAVVEHTNFVGPEHYENNHLLYVAKYLDSESELYRMPDTELFELYLSSLKKINPSFDRSWVKAWKLFRAPATQPITFVGYQHLRPTIKTPIPHLYFASMSHIYPWDRGTDHSFHLGKDAGAIIESEVLSNSLPSAK